VYQYYFVGKRAALPGDPNAPAEEFIFDVTSDRKTTFSVSVLLPEESLRQWSTTHGRSLNEAERYGAVKMRLFQAFDEIEDMIAAGRRLLMTGEILQNVLNTLNVQ